MVIFFCYLSKILILLLQTDSDPSSVPTNKNSANNLPVIEKKAEKSFPQSTKESQIESDKGKDTEQKDASRPISSTAVTGTPWCVVWTGDRRVFFFNPSKRISVWDTPEELKGRADVERLLGKPPNDEKSDGNDEESEASLMRKPPTKKPRLYVTFIND